MSESFPVIIHHNPECGTSRNVVEFVRAAGLDPVVILYLETGWTRPHLLSLFAAANVTPRQALRETKSPAAEMGLMEADVDQSTILAAMLEHPILVNRPFVVTPKGVKLCRPSEAVFSLLDCLPSGPISKADGQLVIDEDGKLLV